MDSYEFHRRQRVQREQDKLHARNVKKSAGTYRMSISALNVAPYLRRRDAERKLRRQTRESNAQAAKVNLNASFVNSTQLEASPRNEAHHKSLLSRVTSFRKSSKSRGPSIRQSLAASNVQVSMSSNPMFDRGDLDSSADEYVVPTPFVLPIESKPRRKLPSFKPGKYFSPGMKSIITAALAEKRAAEKKSNKDDTNTATESESTASPPPPSPVSSSSFSSSSSNAGKQDVLEVGATVGREVVSETIEEDANTDETSIVSSTSRAPSFWRGIFGAKSSARQSTRTSSVPTAALKWPTWMTKGFAAKANPPPEISPAQETSDEPLSTIESQTSAVSDWFNNLIKPTTDASASAKEEEADPASSEEEMKPASSEEDAKPAIATEEEVESATATDEVLESTAAEVEVMPTSAAEESVATEVSNENPRQSTGLGRWFRGIVGTNNTAAVVAPSGTRSSGRSWMPKLGGKATEENVVAQE